MRGKTTTRPGYTGYSRRKILGIGGHAAFAAAAGPAIPSVLLPSRAAAAEASPGQGGLVAGEPAVAQVAEEIFAAGGNAVDAIVATALGAAVVVNYGCGIGGYGGHMTIALAGGKKITSIDFNTMAPAAAANDMFPLDAEGNLVSDANTHGWLAAGVPGTLGGMQLALDLYGTMSFAEVVAPAIRLARDGFPVDKSLLSRIKSAAPQFAADPASRKLWLTDNGNPPAVGSTFRNPDLARLLESLAKQNSVDSFYKGDIAQHIAGEMKSKGGLVTAEDMAAYRAREVEPYRFEWEPFTVFTAPLTAGGATVIEVLSILKSMNWAGIPAGSASSVQSRLEALRLAWHDRLRFFGDPEQADVPIARLLGVKHSEMLAARVTTALMKNAPLSLPAEPARPQGGTRHFSSVDRDGNMVALTLTHGNPFGARITVDGLGLVLGHGMSRFDPRPWHPNAPGPGKRPLHNMCPTIVLKDGAPVLALGGRGGRKIPNAVTDVLLNFLGRNLSMETAVAAPRIHTEGEPEALLESSWQPGVADALRDMGYGVKRGSSAVISAVSFDPATGERRAAMR